MDRWVKDRIVRSPSKLLCLEKNQHYLLNKGPHSNNEACGGNVVSKYFYQNLLLQGSYSLDENGFFSNLTITTNEWLQIKSFHALDWPRYCISQSSSNDVVTAKAGGSYYISLQRGGRAKMPNSKS